MEFELIVTKCQYILLLLDLALSSGSFVILFYRYTYVLLCCRWCSRRFVVVVVLFAQCIYLFAFCFLSHAINVIWFLSSSHSFFACENLRKLSRLVLCTLP